MGITRLGNLSEHQNATRDGLSNIERLSYIMEPWVSNGEATINDLGTLRN